MRAPRPAVILVTALGLAACSGSATTPAAGPAAPAAGPTAIAAACNTPEHRQLDFWVGDWDLIVRARVKPESDEWQEAKGSQRITSILGGCAIEEQFSGAGPGPVWHGRSFSMWQPALGRWRQTWVDDQGMYMLFDGGLEAGVMTLNGTPREQDGHEIRMRMVFHDITADALIWEWQRSVDGGEWAAQLVVDYRRRRV